MSRSALAGLMALALASLLPTHAPCTSFLPLGMGRGTTYWQGEVPFEIDGVYVRVDNYLQNTDSIRLPDVTARAIHVIQTSGYAANVPDGVVAGHLSVFYKDGTSDHLALVVGENTAEWAYDRRELQCCLAHARVRPAYSWRTRLGSDAHYWGHAYAVSMDLKPKALSSLELVLAWEAYMGQPLCPGSCAQTDPDRYSILICAVTLELAAEKDRQVGPNPNRAGPEAEKDPGWKWPQLFAGLKGMAALPPGSARLLQPGSMTAR